MPQGAAGSLSVWRFRREGLSLVTNKPLYFFLFFFNNKRKGLVLSCIFLKLSLGLQVHACCSIYSPTPGTRNNRTHSQIILVARFTK